MKVINIYGEPSSGKSTLAANVFATMKAKSFSCELVTEFAKDMVWDSNRKALSNQAYLFGNQYYRLARIEKDVDFAVVDSPLLLNIIYNHDLKLNRHFNDMVAYVDSKFDNLNFLLKRNDEPYENVGRVHTQEESDEIAKDIESLLKTLGKKYIVVSRRDGCKKILEEVKRHI